MATVGMGAEYNAGNTPCASAEAGFVRYAPRCPGSTGGALSPRAQDKATTQDPSGSVVPAFTGHLLVYPLAAAPAVPRHLDACREFPGLRLVFLFGTRMEGAMKLFSLLVAVVAMSGVSCERHPFEGPNGTKQLHEHTASHGPAADHAAKPEK